MADVERLCRDLFPEGHSIAVRDGLVTGRATVSGETIAILGTADGALIGADLAFALAGAVLEVVEHAPGATILLLVDTGGNNWKYRGRAELETIFTAAGYAPTDAARKVVVSQCRTNFEVQVNGFASRVILGYPTVHFDGSLVEYLSLASNHPTASYNLRPEDPAWRFRTDIPTRTQHFAAGSNPEAPTTTTDCSARRRSR